MKKLLFFLLLASFYLFSHQNIVNAHRSGCHRYHSCSSDSGSYICGDIGHCNYCPDNNFCVNGKPRSKTNNEVIQQSKKGFLAIPKRYYLCIRVVDGDTIIINMNGKDERVRLIGVDTPETKHPKKPIEYFGKEASAFIKSMVEGKKVRLEYEQEQRDKYGRLLAYVYLEDGTFINAEIIKQGYGFAYTKFPFKYLDDFKGYERKARENNKGLWGNK